ncbi:hypothetical protein GCM10027072_06310 [Streptomyces bullii]
MGVLPSGLPLRWGRFLPAFFEPEGGPVSAFDHKVTAAYR